MGRTSPDDVLSSNSARGPKLEVRLLDDQTVLIAGTREALLMLSEAIAAQARCEGDDGFQIGPRGAGSVRFARGSTHGLYIQRKPGRL